MLLCCGVDGADPLTLDDSAAECEKATNHVFSKSVSVMLGNRESVMMLRTTGDTGTRCD